MRGGGLCVIRERLRAAKRKDARQQLQDKSLVVINDSVVLINRKIEVNMEPYLFTISSDRIF